MSSLSTASGSSTPPLDLSSLLREKARHLAELDRRNRTNKLKFYSPYGKQREFHRNGATFSERLFMAGNQLGKTVAGGAEWALHLTGRYPDWWDGATFDKAPLLWAGSVTGESTRDNPQRILIGPPAKEEEWGTGFVPLECIRDRTRAMGVPNLLDSVVVRWGVVAMSRLVRVWSPSRPMRRAGRSGRARRSMACGLTRSRQRIST